MFLTVLRKLADNWRAGDRIVAEDRPGEKARIGDLHLIDSESIIEGAYRDLQV